LGYSNGNLGLWVSFEDSAMSLGRALLLVCSLAAAQNAAVAEDDVALEYSWEQGFLYKCSFDLKTKSSGSSQDFGGLMVYTPLVGDPVELKVAEPRESCTGTAFAISRDGYLVTCAHVVEGATKIVAHFGATTYEATIVAYDADCDLAIVKVDAKDLPCLGFLDSDKVELAQEIRVVGYPLSDVLGESVKMSRGTISGIIQREDENRFQIDAQVNPGNSGGPLVDEQGRVVGIASELLANEAIDSVGFAIPANEALRMAKEKGISVETPPDGDKPDGPDLARRVTPSVALLKVETGPGGYGVTKKQVLYFSGFYYSMGRSPGTPSHDSGKMVVDARGEIQYHDGKLVLPLCLQSLGTIGIERLSGDARRSWKSFQFRVLSIATEADSRPSGPYLPGYDRIHPPGFPAPYSRYRSPLSPYSRSTVQVRIVPAVEEVEYQRLPGLDDGTVKISKTYRYYSVNDEDENARQIDVKTSGTLTWDKELNGIKQAEMSGQVSMTSDNITVRIPIELTYEVTKEKPKPKEPEAAKPQAETAASPEAKPPIRKIESQPTSVEQTPSSAGLSKFNPDD
jgi:S1-C subfamily serine protease